MLSNVTIILTLFFLIQPAYSDSQDQSTDKYIPAKAIKKPNLKYPQSTYVDSYSHSHSDFYIPLSERTRNPSLVADDGWVKINYLVDEKGNAINPIVIDAAGNSKFTQKALDALKDTKHSPATYNDVPIKSGHMSFYFYFSYDKEISDEVSPVFSMRYKKATKLIANNKVREAATILKSLAQNDLVNTLCERSWYYWITAIYNIKTADYELAHLNLERVNTFHKCIPEDTYFTILTQQYFSHIRNLQYQYAFQSLEKINKVATKKDNAAVIALNTHNEKIKETLENEPPISFLGRITNKGTVARALNYRSFSFSETPTPIESFEVRCKRKGFSSDYAVGKTWSIPASWGNDCIIYLLGKNSQTFQLNEYPDQLKKQ